jgi:hypothetical protein
VVRSTQSPMGQSEFPDLHGEDLAKLGVPHHAPAGLALTRPLGVVPTPAVTDSRPASSPTALVAWLLAARHERAPSTTRGRGAGCTAR